MIDAPRMARIARALVLLLALGLRLHALGRFSLGNDEIQEVRFARLPWAEFFWKVADDKVHPPLDYVIQRCLTGLGVSDDARRLPAVMAGTATVAIVMHLAMRWFGGAAGLASGLSLAVSPIHVRYSQEVRPYALGLFFLVASVAALERHRERGSRRSLALWIALVLASAYTLYFAGLMAALVGFFMIAGWRRDGLARAWKALPLEAAVLFVAYLPWLPYATAAARRAPPAPREPIGWTWASQHLQWLGTGDWVAEPPSAGSWAFWLLAAAGLGLALARREKPAIVCALWLSVGMALQIAILQIRPHFPAVRYYLPSWLGAVFLAGYAAGESSKRRMLRLAGFALIALVLVFDAATLRAYYDHGRPQWDRVAESVRAAMHPGERVYSANPWVFRNLGYYWTDRAMGAPGVPLQESFAGFAGPAWLVEASCSLDAGVAAQLEPLVKLSFPYTNRCRVYFVPEGTRIERKEGLCLNP